MATLQGEDVEMSQNTTDEEFLTVSRQSRKRKQTANLMDTSDIEMKRPHLPPISGDKLKGTRAEMRRIPVPPHRYAPLKEKWLSIYTPIVEQLHLQMRFELKSRNVEIKTCKETADIGALQRAADFVRAFTLGFEVEDALALLRLDHLYLESFDITDVKPLKGDHLSRAIGRLAGHHGKTKFTIENVTQTRIVLANSKVHILGSFNNIRVARTAICNLILGSPASKVNGKLRTVAARAAEKF